MANEPCNSVSQYGCICVLDAGHEGDHEAKCGWNHKWTDATAIPAQEAEEREECRSVYGPECVKCGEMPDDHVFDGSVRWCNPPGQTGVFTSKAPEPIQPSPIQQLAQLLTEGGAIPVINGVRIEPIQPSVELPPLDFKPRPFDQEGNWKRRVDCREHQLLAALARAEKAEGLVREWIAEYVKLRDSEQSGFNRGVEAAASAECSRCRSGLPLVMHNGFLLHEYHKGRDYRECLASKIRALKEPKQ